MSGGPCKIDRRRRGPRSKGGPGVKKVGNPWLTWCEQFLTCCYVVARSLSNNILLPDRSEYLLQCNKKWWSRSLTLGISNLNKHQPQSMSNYNSDTFLSKHPMHTKPTYAFLSENVMLEVLAARRFYLSAVKRNRMIWCTNAAGAPRFPCTELN